MKPPTWVITMSILPWVSPAAAWAQSSGTLAIARSTFNASGRQASADGRVVLRSTIGQADATTTLSGGRFELRGGFWPGRARGTAPVLVHIMGGLGASADTFIPPLVPKQAYSNRSLRGAMPFGKST